MNWIVAFLCFQNSDSNNTKYICKNKTDTVKDKKKTKVGSPSGNYLLDVSPVM